MVGPLGEGEGTKADTLTGMGNRFAALPEYRVLIIGHGVMAAITFLLVVPLAIFIARWYYRDGRLALKLHIYLQILTVFLATVVLILGVIAVGPERSLTNPHHGIGVAIYVLVLVQFIGGVLMHHIEKTKTRYRRPLKVVVSEAGRSAQTLADISFIATSMDGPVHRPARHHTNCAWSHLIWLTKDLVHPLRCGCLHLGNGVVHLELLVPEWRSRLRRRPV